MSTVALALALALIVVVPPSSRRRLEPATRRLRWSPAAARATGWLTAAGGCAALVCLPASTIWCLTAVCGTAGARFRRRRRAGRAVAEGRALQSALDVLVGELRAGSPPVRAFDTAADESGEPVGASLRSVAARARLGADVAAGLHAVARRSALPTHWDRLALCWRLASEHGLAIATLMRAAQRDIAERQRFSARVSSSLAGARATAAILAGLPLLGVLLGQLVGARPLSFLLGTPVGGWLLAVGTSLACAGLLWSDRITDRVLA